MCISDVDEEKLCAVNNVLYMYMLDVHEEYFAKMFHLI